VLRLDRSNAKALYRRAVAYEGLRQYELAKADSEAILSADPSNSLASKLLDRVAIALAATNSTSAPAPAAASPSMAATGDQSVDMLVAQLKQRAMQLLHDGRVDSVIAELEAALKTPPLKQAAGDTRAPLLQLLLSSYRSAANNEKVVETCNNILEIDSDNFRARLCRASAHLTMVCHMHDSPCVWSPPVLTSLSLSLRSSV
jgi:hypothetical protein